MQRSLIALCSWFAVTVLPAMAQTTVAPVSPGSTTSTAAGNSTAEANLQVPSVNCTEPKLPQRLSLPQEDLMYLEKQVNDYRACLKAYVDARRVDAQKYADRAKAEADAGNAAVKEVNDYTAKVKAYEASHGVKPAGTQAGPAQ